MADDFTFEITQNIGIISEGKGGWNLELNMVSWGGRPAKYDIRSWSPDHQKMGKGLTLTKEELTALQKTLDSVKID
ncbi:MAG: YdbC family protein [Treponema sp.]